MNYDALLRAARDRVFASIDRRIDTAKAKTAEHHRRAMGQRWRKVDRDVRARTTQLRERYLPKPLTVTFDSFLMLEAMLFAAIQNKESQT